MVVNLDSETRTWGMLCHLSALAGYFFPMGWLIGPLVVWLIKKDQIPFVDDQGKESLNFQLTILIAGVIVLILALVTCGVGAILGIPLAIVDIIFPIIGAVRANAGEYYRYPFNIRFIK